MNTNGEDKLRNALSQRSDVMADSQLDFDAMHQQARGIRRRRRIGTGVAAAAVLAVIAVPTTLMINRTGDDSAPPPATTGTADPTPAPSGTATDNANGGDGQPWPDKAAALKALKELPQGADPQVDYVYGDQVHTSFGDTLDLPDTDYDASAVAAYHGGWMLATEDSNDSHGDAVIRQFDAQGQQVETTPGTAEFVVSNDGTRLAWWTWNKQDDHGELHVAGASGMGEGDGQAFDTGGSSYVVPLGFVSGDEVAYLATDDGASVRIVDGNGDVRDLDGLVGGVSTDSVNGRVAGQVGAGGGWTAAVYDANSGEELWHKDGWTLGRFSPDGKYVIGFEGEADPMKIAILDAATGDVVTEVDLLADYGLNHDAVVWEEDSVLVSAFVMDGTDREPHAGALLRIGLDGDVERATAVDPGTKSWLFLPRP